MPRAKPNQVVEHRISFSDFERKELKQMLDIRDKQVTIANYVNGGKAVLYGASALAVGYFGYLALSEIFDFVDDIAPKAKNIIYGKETYPTQTVPSSEEDWVNRDPDTGERINPVSNVPIMGGLVGLGIQLGEAVPVGSWIGGLFD
jgi:hypothetical protein